MDAKLILILSMWGMMFSGMLFDDNTEYRCRDGMVVQEIHSIFRPDITVETNMKCTIKDE